jgi:serine phosphatase RsbU (regulator of sigma subunit)
MGSQTLILYTDGVTDAKKPGNGMFGEEGIEHALVACTGAPDCAIDHITKALLQHQRGLRPEDDQTIIAAQVL